MSNTSNINNITLGSLEKEFCYELTCVCMVAAFSSNEEKLAVFRQVIPQIFGSCCIRNNNDNIVILCDEFGENHNYIVYNDYEELFFPSRWLNIKKFVFSTSTRQDSSIKVNINVFVPKQILINYRPDALI